jgi:UDP-N-acetylglucosamine 2-epimerase (non-hydrolysing)
LTRSAVFHGDHNGIVLVHGDTFSTAIGALIGKLAGLKVGHVESGLRSFNLLQPFPEELTRLVTFRLTDYYFCPGGWAVSNLSKYRGEKIDTEYNTLLDSLAAAVAMLPDLPGDHVPKKPYGIVTLHRFENFRDHASALRCVELVERVAKRHFLLFILHKPTERNLRLHGLYDRLAENPNIELRPRYDYFHFVKLLWDAKLVLSDGGSNQEECFYLGKPTLLVRNVTERREGLDRNVVVSKFDPAVVDAFLDDLARYSFPPLVVQLSPSRRIVEACAAFV